MKSSQEQNRLDLKQLFIELLENKLRVENLKKDYEQKKASIIPQQVQHELQELDAEFETLFLSSSEFDTRIRKTIKDNVLLNMGNFKDDDLKVRADYNTGKETIDMDGLVDFFQTHYEYIDVFNSAKKKGKPFVSIHGI